MGEELVWSVKNGDLSRVKSIVESEGINVNQEVLNGRGLLHVAADYGQTEVLEYLLSKGANVNALDKHGITPLLAAVFENHLESAKLLLSKGADKTMKSPGGDSYYDCAETAEMKELLK